MKFYSIIKNASVANGFLLAFLLLVCSVPAFSQNYATGLGKGALQKEIFWLTWNNGLITRPAGSDSAHVFEGLYEWQLTPTVKVSATISGITTIAANCLLASYTSGTFNGDGLGGQISDSVLYPGIKTSGIVTSVAGNSQVKFNIAAKLQFFRNGSWQAVAYPGLVAGDAESMASGEFLKATAANTSGLVNWQVIDIRNNAFPRSKADNYLLKISNSGSDFMLSNNDGFDDINVQAVLFAKGATQLNNIEMRGRGQTAIAIGLVAPFDFGDAPTTFGNAGHYIDSFSLVEPLTTADANYPITQVPKATFSTISRVFMGSNNVDADGNPPNSIAANTDDITNKPDENGFSLSTQPVIKVNNTNNITVNVNVSNNKLVAATLYGWIDFNGDGQFSTKEAASASVQPGANQTIILTFNYNNFGSIIKQGTAYARFRITTTAISDNITTANIDERSTATTLDGEAEDYKLNDIQGVNVSGNVFDDVDGTTNGLIDGTGVGILEGQQLYAYIVDASNVIIQKTTVDANGLYAFSGLNSGTYKVAISTNNVLVGSGLASIPPNLSANWVAIGETYGTNNLAGSGIELSIPNLQIPVNTPSSGLDITNLNFGLNQKPIAVNDATTTTQNVSVAIDVKLNDSDPENLLDSTSVQLIDPKDGIEKNSVIVAGQGTYTVNTSTGVVNFIPIANFAGIATPIKYTIKDKAGIESAPASLTVSVNPVGVKDLDTTLVNTPIQLFVKNNDGIAATKDAIGIASTPKHGKLVLNPDSTFTYTPTNGFKGNDTCSYFLTTPDGLVSAPITMVITVLATPKPVGVPDFDTTFINSPIISIVKKNDGTVNANNMVTIATNPSHGTVVVNPLDSTVTYTPTPGYTGKDSYTYTLTTPDGVVSNPITVSLVVKPVGVPDTDTTNIDTPIKNIVKNNDGSSGIKAKVAPATNPLHGTIIVNPIDSTITYTPFKDYVGKDSYTYTLTTPDGVISAPITVSLVVKPIGLPDFDTTNINTSIKTIVKNNDGTSGVNAKVTPATNPLHGTVVLNPIDSTITYTPAIGYTGKDSYTYTLTTPDGVVSDPITVSLVVKPVGVPDKDTTLLNTPINTIVKNNDGTSGNGSKVNIATNPIHGTVIVNPDSTVTYTPNNGYVGKDSYTYTLTTPDGVVSNPITVSLVVKPVGIPDVDTTNIDTPIKTNVKKNDGASGLNAKVTPATNPLHGTIRVNPDSTITYTPQAGYTGKDSYTYTLTTPDGLVSPPITVSLTVKPVGVPDKDTTLFNTPVTTIVKTNDGLSAIGATVAIAVNPNHGSAVVGTDGSIQYTPVNGYLGDDSYTYTLTTPDGIASEPITVLIHVKPLAAKRADMSIKKVPIYSGAVYVGSDVSFKIVVTNNGPDAATNITVNDALATNLDAPKNIDVTIGTTDFDPITRNFTWAFTSFAPNTSDSITITTTVLSGTSVSNIATVSATETDPVIANNTATITNIVIQPADIAIPNVLTPNGNGKNDKFFIRGLSNYPGSDLSIYNRWDNLVYHSSNYLNDWDGKGLVAGTYYFVLKIKKTEGFDVRKGWVLLMK